MNSYLFDFSNFATIKWLNGLKFAAFSSFERFLTLIHFASKQFNLIESTPSTLAKVAAVYIVLKNGDASMTTRL